MAKTGQPNFLVSIVIPNYRRFDLLQKCLDAIPDAMGDISYEVILVENGSPKEESRQFFASAKLPPNTKIVKLVQNIGFPGACNRGFKGSVGALTFILTNDVILDPGSGEKMVMALDDPTIGVVGMKLRFPSDRELEEAKLTHGNGQRPADRVQHVGLFTNIHGQVFHMYLGWSVDNPRVCALREVYAVTGAAFMTRKKIFQQTGGFDEIFGSGCLVGDTMVYTNFGIKPLSDFISGSVEGLYPNSIMVASDDKDRASNLFYVNGEQQTRKITTEKDFSLQGTLNHKVRYMSPDGKIEWKEIGDIQIGDWIPIRSGSCLFGTNHLDADDAYFCGLYLADGSTEKGGRVTITKPDKEIVDFLLSRGFVSQGKLHHRKNGLGVWLSKYVDTTQKALTKEISPFFLCSDKETQIALLQGMFDGDGCAIKDGRINYSSSSYKLVKQLQLLLLNFGIVVGIYPRYGVNGLNYLLDFGSHSGKFYDLIGFRLSRKQERNALVRESLSPIVPFQRRAFREVWEEIGQPKGLACYANSQSEGVRLDTLKLLTNEAYKHGLTWQSRGMCDLGEHILYEDWVWLQVKKIEDGGIQPTYDIHVPSNHTYLANGFVVHNTYEDVSFCMQVHEMKLKVIVEQQATAKHYTGATAEKFQAAFPLNKNKSIFEQKWYNKLVYTEWMGW